MAGNQHGERADSSGTHRTIHLFRKGLRLHDNPSLLTALGSSAVVFPVYVLDRAFLEGSMSMGAVRWRFLLQSLEDLRMRLIGLGSYLYVLQGQYEITLRDLVARWGITQITFDAEVEPFYIQLDQILHAMGRELGVSLRPGVMHTLYSVTRIVEVNGGQPPLTYRKFLRVLSAIGEPNRPARDITASDFQKCPTLVDGSEEEFRVPSLEDLNIALETEVLWPGGESHALQRLEKHFQSQGWMTRFSRPRLTPNSLLPSTTRLSPYFSLGCLSVRTFYHRLSSICGQFKNHLLPPVALQGQVLWREFFYTVASATPNFASMVGNPICLQINWNHNPEALEKWRMAKTGFPWIDAIMTQLRQEGWIHHLARHAVACFLTWGDLWISWEEGMKVFEEYLLDADYSVNAGNWMWLSSSAFFHRYTRIVCPVRFGRRTDPHGQYLRKYLPVLKEFPSRYIFEPWTAPLDVQMQAGCVIGKDYPLPMVSHSEVSQRNLVLMQQVYCEQAGTTQLTLDVTGDTIKLKHKCGYCEDQGQPNKRPAPSSDGSCPILTSPCSWIPDVLSVPKFSAEVM